MKRLSIATKLVTLGLAMFTFCGVIPATANHKSGVPPLDFALKGVNAPGWTSKGDCANDRPGQGCRLIINNCNGSGYDLYTTQRIFDMIDRNVSDGVRVVVHTMTDSGHFKDRICSLFRN